MIKHPIPNGYQCLYDAVEDVGRLLFKDQWTGQERQTSRYALDGPYVMTSDLENLRKADEVETKCSQILFSGACSALAVTSDGDFEEIKPKKWITPSGCRALESDYPGTIELFENCGFLDVLLLDGALVDALNIEGEGKADKALRILSALYPSKSKGGKSNTAILEEVNDRFPSDESISRSSLAPVITKWFGRD